MDHLATRHCRTIARRLSEAETREFTAQLAREWTVGDHRLRRTYRFADFAGALSWVNAIAAIAEAENHHPDIHLAWGRVDLELWTHSVGGLSENDFILAARIDRA